MIQAGIETLNRTSFARLSKKITGLAQEILRNASLPTDVNGAYVVSDENVWRPAKATRKSRKTLSEFISFHKLVSRLGIAIDSPEGYAVRLLILVDNTNTLIRSGQVDEAMATAVSIGELVNEASMKEVWEKDALRGAKVLESARSGHEQVHGTREAKEARWATYFQAYEKYVAQGLAKMTAYEEAAEDNHVSAKTIQRAVKFFSR